MTQEYTPTDEVIKDAACFPKPTRLGEPYPIDPDDYDRWLAAHDAQIRADEHVKALELSGDETQIFANGIHAFTHEWGSFLDCDLEIGLDAVAEHRKEQK